MRVVLAGVGYSTLAEALAVLADGPNLFLEACRLTCPGQVETMVEAVKNGFIYMASLMAILLSHEMGHYVMARHNRVDASLPYFIPFPFNSYLR